MDYNPAHTKRFYLSLLSILLIASPAAANVYLQAGDLSLELWASASWTVHTLTWNGQVMMGGNVNSASGSVLNIDGQWAGSAHGNEQLLSAQLLVDGVPQTLTDGWSYSGNDIVIQRSSIIGGAYHLTSTMEITPSGTQEHVIFQGLDAGKTCDAFYALLGTRDNRLTQYSAVDAQGRLLYSGYTDENDEGGTILSGAVSVTQYDPIWGNGVISTIELGRDAGLRPVIQDRFYENKLYFILPAGEGPAYPSNFFEFSQTLSFFQHILHLVMVPALDPEGSTPKGYTAYDFFAVTDTNLGRLELTVNADQQGMIYQHPSGGILAPDPVLVQSSPALGFDTYLDMPVDYGVVGPAVNIQPGSSTAFDSQNINIAWKPATGSRTGPGTFHIGRLTLADWATGSWTIMGWQDGDSEPFVLHDDIFFLLPPPDVDGDGFFGAKDLNVVLSNWGMSGAVLADGDVNGDGFVGGLDYTVIMQYWGQQGLPTDIPEPATLRLIALGMLTCCRRSWY